MAALEQLKSQLEAEKEKLKEFVDMANRDVAAREGRISAFEQAIAILETPEPEPEAEPE